MNKGGSSTLAARPRGRPRDAQGLAEGRSLSPLRWPGLPRHTVSGGCAEATVLRRVANAARRALEAAGATSTDLLQGVAQALGADEAFLMLERGGGLEVLAFPESGCPTTVPKELRRGLLAAGGTMDEPSIRQLSVVVGARSRHLSAAACRPGRPVEVLVVGWREGAGLTRETMELAAGMTGSANLALESRTRTVHSVLGRERSRLAYELHDGLTQAVTSAVLELEGLRDRIERDAAEALKALDSARAHVRGSLSELRGLLFDLSDDTARDATAVREEPLTRWVREAMRRWKLDGRVCLEGDLEAAPKPLLAVAYVVIREALTNTAKHASRRKASVLIQVSADALVAEVRDAGPGFRAQADAAARGHFGLGMMRRRVEEVGGSLDVRSSPSGGTRVRALLPFGGKGGPSGYLRREEGSGA